MRKNPLSNMSAHGGIITSEFLETIQGENVKNPRVEPQCFATFNQPIPPKDKRELGDKIANSFKLLLERWDAISLRYQKMPISEARSKWMVPLFKELGFDPDFRREEIVVGGDDNLRFRLSHRGWSSESAPKIHMVTPSQDLEEASDNNEGEVVRRGRTRSPHDEMQAYLNLAKDQKWGIVTNGILLRILRDYFHTTTKGYVEFDLENIFRERSFTDFRAMYRMVHASRFLPDQDGISPLEHFYKESVAAGVKVGEDLRQNVKKAIEALGNGFLTPELTKKMIEDEELCKTYYAELLRVIYRLLFLLFAEQRAMLPTKESIYIEEYSITRLRQMAEERHGKDDHHDLWEGLKVTFHMLKKGCSPLRVFGYNGSLFDDNEIVTLASLCCKNEYILEAIRHLTLVEEEKVLKRINYLDLGVSEIGSIYESLLDFVPRVFSDEQEIDGEVVPANTFFLTPVGAARKATGSYYTPPILVDQVVKSTLELVVRDKMAKYVDKEKGLLSIKVCDPACGSGAFLISACNYLGRELAKIRSKTIEPSDKEVKTAKRDVLQHCIYAVDLNPMAVELAKVSLWIDSSIEEMPLSFLDHHIKCGNSLIGASPTQIKNGIPDDAFTCIKGDNKAIEKAVKKQNNLAKKQTLMVEFSNEKILPHMWAQKYNELSDEKELYVEDVEKKRQSYWQMQTSPEMLKGKLVADTWCSAFFWKLTKEAPSPPTESILRLIQKDLSGRLSDNKTFEEIKRLSVKLRYFHWFLEFPDVFENGNGFDCVIGNPPWDKIIADKRQFFLKFGLTESLYDADQRDKEIARILKDPTIQLEYEEYIRHSDATSKFLHNSLSFEHQSSIIFGEKSAGKENTYSYFLEISAKIIGASGCLGLVLPKGFQGDAGVSALRKYLMSHGTILVKAIENCTEGIKLFSNVADQALITLLRFSKNPDSSKNIVEAKFCSTFSELDSEFQAEHILSLSELEKMFPETFEIVCFESKVARDIASKLFSFPSLSTSNSFEAEAHRELNMTEDRYMFTGDVTEIPLWEGSLVGQFRISDSPKRYVIPKMFLERERRDFTSERLVVRAILPNSARKVIAAMVPKKYALGNSLNYLTFPEKYSHGTYKFYLLGIINSFITEYILKMTRCGYNLNPFRLKGLPVPRLSLDSWYMQEISARVARLICYRKEFSDIWSESYDSKWKLLGQSMGGTSELSSWEILGKDWNDKFGIFAIDEESNDVGDRGQLRCEIDALVAHLYGLSHNEFQYILSTFNAEKEKAPWLVEGALREFVRLCQCVPKSNIC